MEGLRFMFHVKHMLQRKPIKRFTSISAHNPEPVPDLENPVNSVIAVPKAQKINLRAGEHKRITQQLRENQAIFMLCCFIVSLNKLYLGKFVIKAERDNFMRLNGHPGISRF